MAKKSGEKCYSGTYYCSKCKKPQIVQNNDDLLNQCPCGNNIFYLHLPLSDDGRSKKFRGCLKNIETNYFLYNFLKDDCYLSVIAVQLRILLTDKIKDRLLPKIIENPRFHPICSPYNILSNGDSIILPENLFDKTKDKITLDQWLDQKVYIDIDEAFSIKISEIIKFWSNKNGGAHLEDSINEIVFRVLEMKVFHDYILKISEYLINDVIEYDFLKELSINVISPLRDIFLNKESN
jgi:DNA-directed RNA polymerase subunit RPC12/RpoP